MSKNFLRIICHTRVSIKLINAYELGKVSRIWGLNPPSLASDNNNFSGIPPEVPNALSKCVRARNQKSSPICDLEVGFIAAFGTSKKSVGAKKT